jgi:hypothetical protein
MLRWFRRRKTLAERPRFTRLVFVALSQGGSR